MKKIITHNEKETLAFANKLSKILNGGDILCLYGNLGAGKSVLARGIAKALSIKGSIQSPTFVLMKVYKIKKHKSIKQLCHIDAYRLSDGTELEDIGIQEYFNDKNTLTIIEWPENIKVLLKKYKKQVKKIQINMDLNDESVRQFIISK